MHRQRQEEFWCRRDLAEVPGILFIRSSTKCWRRQAWLWRVNDHGSGTSIGIGGSFPTADGNFVFLLTKFQILPLH